MGGTTKEKDQYKIGQFGTGLKYTLAFLYRNNLDFKIYVGNELVKIDIETETIRDEVFEIICINGNRTSITTKMGSDWKTWMVIRELWCNALDEGGAHYEITDNPVPHEDKTVFYIQVDSQIQEVLDNWGKYFIHNQEPLHETDTHKIYAGGQKLRFYKQGVLIYESEHHKALFSYDIKNARINELREYNSTLTLPICEALSQANEKVAQYFLENITEVHFEGKDGTMDYDWMVENWSKSWTNVIGNSKIIYKKAVEDAKARGISIDTVKNVVVPRVVYKALTKQFDGIGALRVASKANEFLEHYDPILHNRVKQALVILEQCDYMLHPDLQFVFGYFGDKTRLACVNLDEKKIYICNTMLNSSLFEIVAMLIEENEHFNTGLSDETRAFQQHFINLYTKTLLAKNEVEI